MPETQWARLRSALDCPLRRGAWYRVVTVTRLEAVVDVQGESVSVARPSVEIRTLPPREWTVVRQAQGSPGAPDTLQSGYVVCPSCRNRVVLPFARVSKLRCSGCNELFPIAWEEEYWENV